MSYDIINIDTSVYSLSADRVRAAAQRLESATDKLLGVMNSASSSAGNGAGARFAAEYEPQAAAALESAGTLISSLYAVSARFIDSGNTHEHTERLAAGQGSNAASPAAAPVVMIPQPPSISGGTGSTPTGWHFVEYLVTELWPDADTGRLSALASAWHEFGDVLAAARAVEIADVMAPFSGYLSPEIPAAHAVIDQLSDDVNAAASFAHDIGTGISGFVSQVTRTHSEVIDDLNELLLTIAGGMALSLILTPVTMGISDAVDAGVDAAELSATAYRISTALRELGSLKWFRGGAKVVRGLVDLASDRDAGLGRVAAKLAIGSVKGAYSGALIWAPSSMFAQQVVTGRVDVGRTELAGVAGGFAGGTLESGLSGLGEVWAEVGTQSTKAATQSAVPGLEEDVAGTAKAASEAPEVKTEPSQAGARHLAGPEHRAASWVTSAKNTKIAGGELTGKAVGAVGGSATALAIQKKLSWQSLIKDAAGEFTEDKVVIVWPEALAAHG